MNNKKLEHFLKLLQHQNYINTVLSTTLQGGSAIALLELKDMPKFWSDKFLFVTLPIKINLKTDKIKVIIEEKQLTLDDLENLVEIIKHLEELLKGIK